ncbi:MAG: hypothetical protein WA001_03520 [Patescibacteria group bacterium]
MQLCRGATVLLEVNCESLPTCADPVVHFISPNGEDVAIIFSSTLHPSHLPGINGHADNVLRRHGGAEALAHKVSPRVERKSRLHIDGAAGFVSLVLSIEGSHDLRISESLSRLSRSLEPAPGTRRAQPPRASGERSLKVRREAGHEFHGPKPKQRKAG